MLAVVAGAVYRHRRRCLPCAVICFGSFCFFVAVYCCYSYVVDAVGRHRHRRRMVGLSFVVVGYP